MRTHLLATTGVAALLASTALRSVLSCAGSSYPPATMRQNTRATRTLRALLLVSAALGVPAAAGPALAQNALPLIDQNNSVTVSGTVASTGVTVGATTGTNAAGMPGGQLIVPAGAQLDLQSLTIGRDGGSTGQVIVNGGVIQGTSSGNLFDIGSSGSGELIIQNGGTVNATFTRIAVNAGSTGTLTVTGPGSTYAVSGGGTPLFAAGAVGGSPATVNILNGGVLTSAATIQIGGP